MSNESDSYSFEFGKQLAKLGLDTKAQRVEETGRKSAQRDGNCDKWWIFIPWDSHLRTSRGYAQREADKQLTKYSPLRELITDSFGVLTFRYCLSLDPTRGTERMLIFQLRDLLRRLVPNGMYKIGTIGNDVAIKVLSLEPLTKDLISRIEPLLPRMVRIEWANRHGADFDACLCRLLAPDIPPRDDDRARLEYVLDHIRQVALFGTAYGVIYKSNIILEKYPRNPLKTKDRPRNPKTDAIATCYGPPKVKEIPFEEIDPTAWQQYQDFIEVDATSPAEYAEIAASLPVEPSQP